MGPLWGLPLPVGLPDPFPRGPRVTPSLLRNTSRTGVSSGRATSPAPPHTQTGTLRAGHCLLALGCHSPWDLSGGWVQRAGSPLASRGQERHPCLSGGDRAGDALPPPAVSTQGAPSTLLGSVSPHLAGPWAAPARGSVGSCYSVPNPTGHRAIYLDVGPAPPLTSPTLSTSGKAALYAHLPPLSIRPRASQQPCAGVGSKRQVADIPPVACNAEGPGSSLFS